MNSNSQGKSSQGEGKKWFQLMESKNTMTWIAMIFIVIVATMVSSMENSWYNTYVYDNVTPNPQPVAWMVSISAITAALSAIVFGAASDRHRGRWGRRRPFILFGFLLAGALTIVFAFTDRIESIKLAIPLIVIIDSVMMIGFGAAYDGSFGGYVTDITNKNNRGRVQSIISIVTGVGGILTSVIAGITIDNLGYSFFFTCMGVLMIVAGVIGGLILQDKPVPEQPEDANRKSLIAEILGNFSLESIKKNKDLFLLLLAVTIWGSGWYAVVIYQLIYVMQYLGFSATDAGLASAITAVVGLFFALPIGALSDRFGRKKISVISLIIMIGGAIIYSLLKPGSSFIELVIFQMILMLPLTGFGVCGNAWAKDLYPKNKTAQFSGLALIFIVTIPMIIGSSLGSFVIQKFGTPVVVGGEAGTIPSPALFYLAAAATVLCIIPILFISEKHKANEEVTE